MPDPRAELGVSDKTDVGEAPKVVDPKEGCRFQPRCPYAIARCETETPVLRELGTRRLVACHVAEADPQDLLDGNGAGSFQLLNLRYRTTYEVTADQLDEWRPIQRHKRPFCTMMNRS